LAIFAGWERAGGQEARWEFGPTRPGVRAVGPSVVNTSSVCPCVGGLGVKGLGVRELGGRETARPGDDGGGLHEEDPQGMLEGSDGTGGIGEGGLEMGEDLRHGSAAGPLGRSAPRQECRADVALAQDKAFPDALPGAIAEMASSGVDGSADASDGGTLQELPQRGGGQAETSDFIGKPDAEGAPAAAACLAVAAKEASGAARLSLGSGVVIAVEKAVPHQIADGVAMGTGR